MIMSACSCGESGGGDAREDAPSPEAAPADVACEVPARSGEDVTPVEPDVMEPEPIGDVGAAVPLPTPLPVPDPAPLPAPEPRPAPPDSVPAPTPAPVPQLSSKLVPKDGLLWGAAAGAFTTMTPEAALLAWETQTRRRADVFHVYHRGDQPFPTKAEVSFLRETGRERILFANWKVAWETTWAAVARGDHDARIDAAAARFKAYAKPFFLAVHHEPENDVKGAGTGMTAKDYAAMYRHTVLRLRAQGATNIVPVWAIMTYEPWLAATWWEDLYPGNDVVDWIGFDSYASATPGYHYGNFNTILDRSGGEKSATPHGLFQWAISKHPWKPIMLAEWGVYLLPDKTGEKAPFIASVRKELDVRAKRAAAAGAVGLKAMVAFDSPKDQHGQNHTVLTDPQALAAMRKLAADPVFVAARAGAV